MDRLRILITDDASAAGGLSEMLRGLGHDVISCAASGIEAIGMALRHAPDLVVMDIRMDGVDGLEASRRILSTRPLPILILAACGDLYLIEQAESIGVSGYMLKPCRRNDLEPALALACCRFRQLQALKKEIGDLQEALKARKLIEQAKGLLMEREDLSEPEAFRRIQKMSRDRNIPMVKIAEAIILTGPLGTDAKAGARRVSAKPDYDC
jgi:two-component system, response regulator PdtaR